jgi:hypothetical protein
MYRFHRSRDPTATSTTDDEKRARNSPGKGNLTVSSHAADAD